MKTRNGFVSNSSSSSFIVGFEKDPKELSVSEIQSLFFGEKEIICSYDEGMLATELAKILHKDLFDAPELKTHEEFLEEVMSGYYPGYPKLDFPKDYSQEAYKKWHDEFDELNRAGASKIIDPFLKKNSQLRFFLLEYEDHSISGQILEHGNFWKNIPHIQVSKH
jgi:hypothetical protein